MSKRMNSRRAREARRMAFERQEGLCVLCGKQMAWMEKGPPLGVPEPLMCTLEHWIPHNDPRRGELKLPKEIRWAASHYRCNKERAGEHPAERLFERLT